MKGRKTDALAVAASMIFSSLLAVAFIKVKPAFALQDNAKGKANVAAKKPGKVRVYTCVHHPDITADSPDTCPKCLMVLTKKSRTKTKRS